MGASETVVTFEPREGLWRVADVARFLAASRSWVYQNAEAGNLPCLRLGGLLRFDAAEIRAWVDKQRGADVIALKGRRT